MKKKNIIIFFMMLCLAWCPSYSLQAQGEPSFEDFLKELEKVDWDEVAREMEKELKTMEEKKGRSDEEPGEKEPTKAAGKTGPAIDLSKRDAYDLFINPVLEEKDGKKSWIAQPSLDACKRIFNSIAERLTSIQKKFLANPKIGPEFKDAFMAYQGYIDLFKTAAGIITSKTLYQRILLLAVDEKAEGKGKIDKKNISKGLAAYRKHLAEQLKTLITLDQKLRMPTAAEEEQEKHAAKLQEYAQQKERPVQQKEEAIKFKTGTRGQPSAPSKTPQSLPVK